MGGAEKWMADTASHIRLHEETVLMSVHESIANIYGKLILKRKFRNRQGKTALPSSVSLTKIHFFPLTREWHETRQLVRDARLIYFKYEVLEFLILLYFGGFSVLSKSIAGVHSPFHYDNPNGIFGKAHNVVYESGLSIWVMSKLHKMHVMNKKDEKIMKHSFQLKNISYIPNSVPEQLSESKKKNNLKTLKILFVGELSDRKGFDYLVESIRNSPDTYHFTVAGDGPYQSQMKRIAREETNCDYVGFVSKEALHSLYEDHDILFLPSRAETMSLSVLEALSHGLLIVDSPETHLGFDRAIEYTPKQQHATYLTLFKEIFHLKEKNKIDRGAVKKFFNANFSPDIVMPQLTKNIFELNV